MFLQIARRPSLACANADDRLHGQRIDKQHDDRHQPVEPQHGANQHDDRQQVAHQIVGQPDRRLADKVQIVHDPRHEGARRFARQHREVGVDERSCHVLLQVGRHPQRQRVHLHRLREQRHPLHQRQQDDGRRGKPDHLGRAAVRQRVENITGQQRIG